MNLAYSPDSGSARRKSDLRRPGPWVRIAVVGVVLATLVIVANFVLFWPVDHKVSRSAMVMFGGPGILVTFDAPANTVVEVLWSTQPAANVSVCPSPAVNTVPDVPCGAGPHGNYTFSTYPPVGGGLVAIFGVLSNSSAGPVNVSVQAEYETVFASQL